MIYCYRNQNSLEFNLYQVFSLSNELFMKLKTGLKYQGIAGSKRMQFMLYFCIIPIISKFTVIKV